MFKKQIKKFIENKFGKLNIKVGTNLFKYLNTYIYIILSVYISINVI